jgi:hypothetical protein
MTDCSVNPWLIQRCSTLVMTPVTLQKVVIVPRPSGMPLWSWLPSQKRSFGMDMTAFQGAGGLE